MENPPIDSSASDTRARLLAAGLHHFGQYGFDATSTRKLAADAQTNIASIAYHFGGKAGLRAACADEVARHIGTLTAAAAIPGPLSPGDARALLDGLLRSVVTFLTADPAAQDIPAFVLREIAEDGPGLDRLYSGLFEPAHKNLCRIWGYATGADPEAQDIRLAVFSMIGQLVYFRVGQPLILRRMGWAQYDADAQAAISRRLSANLHALLDGSHD